MPPEIARARELVEHGEYFEAHDVLEDVWQTLPPGPKKELYQGLIQAAVAFYQYRRGNRTGMHNMLRWGLPRIEANASLDVGLDLHRLVAELRPIADLVATTGTLDGLEGKIQPPTWHPRL
ncbi:MAG: DUF309 domain-containing protein [Methanobacteriota archaeon]